MSYTSLHLCCPPPPLCRARQRRSADASPSCGTRGVLSEQLLTLFFRGKDGCRSSSGREGRGFEEEGGRPGSYTKSWRSTEGLWHRAVLQMKSHCSERVIFNSFYLQMMNCTCCPFKAYIVWLLLATFHDADISTIINCQRGARIRKYDQEIHQVWTCAWVCKDLPCVGFCHRATPRCARVVIWQH